MYALAILDLPLLTNTGLFSLTNLNIDEAQTLVNNAELIISATKDYQAISRIESMLGIRINITYNEFKQEPGQLALVLNKGQFQLLKMFKSPAEDAESAVNRFHTALIERISKTKEKNELEISF